MPRVSIRDARCFTDASFPVLPFLAPRAFTEPFALRPTLRRKPANHVAEQREKHCKNRQLDAFIQDQFSSRLSAPTQTPTRSNPNATPIAQHCRSRAQKLPTLNSSYKWFWDRFCLSNTQSRNYTSHSNLRR